MGTVQAFGFDFAPKGWMTCQGQILNISTNTALFALLGVTFGGNGSQTFGLPNLQGRTIVGQGNSTFGSYSAGQMSGSTQITLLQSQMPMHTHSAVASGSISVGAPAYEDVGNVATPGPNTVLAQPTSGNLYSTEQPSTNMLAGTGTVTGLNVQIGTAGGSQPVSIESPYLVMNYSIAITGIFPSRG